jgi:hypothetical protein
MPRPRVENKKQVFAIRLTPEMAAEVRRLSPNMTAAVEEGLRLWLAREQRKAKAKPAPLARHLALPTAREITARRKDDAA